MDLHGRPVVVSPYPGEYPGLNGSASQELT
jgi:hypothetical protein